MLSIEKCRQVLKKNGEYYTDEEIIGIRDFLYFITEMYVEQEEEDKLKEESQSQPVSAEK